MPAYTGLSYTVSFGTATFTVGGRAFRVDDTAYQNMNLDVKAAVAAGVIPNGFAHWLSNGWSEGRSISINGNNFVESAYLSQYPDVATAKTMGLESGFHHWIDNGAAEGRTTGGYLTQQGAAGNDTLVAGAGIVRGYEGDDSIVSGGTAYGGMGNDTVSGGDLIYGNQGDDSISGGATAMYGGQGNDTVSGSYQRNDMIYGNMGDDALYGGYLYLGRGAAISGNDYIHGGKGNDSIYGQGENDTLFGGLGADQFRFDGAFASITTLSIPSGTIIIRDFKADENDRIVFPTSGFFPSSFSTVLERATDGPNGVVIDLTGRTDAGGGTLTLTGVSKAQLQSEWFLFV